MNYKIYPLGESAVTIDFGNQISIKVNQKVINISKHIEQNNFTGFIECVPAYATLTVFYDVFQVRKHYSDFHTAFEFVKYFLKNLIEKVPKEEIINPKMKEISISFDEESSLDLEFVAETNSLTTVEVCEIFLSKTYRVFMLGFLPGFAYMGELDERIATPRKQTPRTTVPKGSVGIAGKQTGIYPLESPGGWQIIGRTDVELFNPNNEKPTLFQAGDLVKFVKK